MRIVIGGVPRAGKSTLAERMRAELGYEVMHTDDLIHLGWSEASAEGARFMLARPGPWIVEGVAAIRSLRKALAAGSAKPCDKLVWLGTPYVEQSDGQRVMGKGAETVLAEIEPDLRARGVFIVRGMSELAAPVTQPPAPPRPAGPTAPHLQLAPRAPSVTEPAGRIELPRRTTGRWGSTRGPGFG